MADPESPQGKLYTLSEISQRTGISMPTLQRYKKMYQDRIPAEGKGRKQRYPDSALPVFDQIRRENLGRRGRPPKNPNAPRAASVAKRGPGRPRTTPPAAAPRRRPGRKPLSRLAGLRGRGRKAAAPARGNLLTLTQISETTGISYPTLVRYVRMHADRLPHEGKGRARRFYPAAVEVFRQLRQESGRGGRRKGSGAKAAAPVTRGRGRRGRPPATAAASSADSGMQQRLRAIEKNQEELERKLRGLVKNLQSLFR
jgi:predicted DNA-binding transcriptional regulator AlpA